MKKTFRPGGKGRLAPLQRFSDIMSSMLTPNACIDMCYGEKPTRPVVQLVDVRLQGKNIRGVVSDGETTYFAVFNSAVAKMFRSESNPDGQVELYSAVRLTDYTISTISAETRVAVVMGMEMNESQPEGKIGEPVSAKDKGKPEPAELPAATPSKGPSPNGHSNTTPESSQQSRVAPAGFAPKPAARASEPAAPGRPTPIEALNPYSRTWTVRAKVTENGELRSITTKAGETMSVWEMVIADESGEIKCTAWRADAERFARIAELGSTYLVSRGQIKIANKRYSSTANNYEITLGADSAMVKQDVELKTFTPTYHFDFTPIADISAKPANSTVDVIGSVTEVGPVQNIVSKTGRELVKRVINLSDDSNAAIEVTLWGKSAETFAEDAAATAAVVAFKGLVVSEWNTRSLGAVRSTKIQMDPDLPQAKRVKAWADTGAASAATSLSINTSGGGSGGGGASMADDLAELLGLPPSKIPEKGAYATVGGYISRILTSKGGGGGGPAEERPIWYSACPKCNKKAIGEYGAGWSCESCGWSGDACTHRYIVAMQLIDASGTSYATAYQEQAIAIFGKTADELKAIKDADQSAFEAECSSVVFKRRTFRLRAKIETYQGVDRTKVGVVNSTPTTPITEGKRMLADIMKYDLPEPPAPEPSATPDEPMPQAAAADEAAEPAAVKA